jgi:hypothetical protein
LKDDEVCYIGAVLDKKVNPNHIFEPIGEPYFAALTPDIHDSQQSRLRVEYHQPSKSTMNGLLRTGAFTPPFILRRARETIYTTPKSMPRPPFQQPPVLIDTNEASLQ